MNPETVSKWLVLAWIMLLIAYDLFMIATFGKEASVSEALKKWVEWEPILLIALGCLIWHLFGRE